MGALFWLSDEQWAAIEPHPPKNQQGARRVDDRRVISGILHVLKIGRRWRDRPAEHGPSTTVYNRSSHKLFWLRLLEAMASSGTVTTSTAIDSIYVKAQRRPTFRAEAHPRKRRRHHGRARTPATGRARPLRVRRQGI